LISPAGAAARRQVIPPVHPGAEAAVVAALHPVHRAEAADKMNFTCSINS